MFNTFFSEISVEQQELVSGGTLVPLYKKSLHFTLNKSNELIRFTKFLVGSY